MEERDPDTESINLDVNDPAAVVNDDNEPEESVNLDAQMFENVAAINNGMSSSITDLEELKESLIALLKNLKLDNFITTLKNNRDSVDGSFKKQNIAVTSFSAVSAAGGITMLAGGAGALATCGASFCLVLVGGAIVGLGTFGTLASQMGGKIRRRLIIRQCKKELKKIEISTEEIGKKYEEFRNKCIGVCTALEQFELGIEDLKKLDPVLFKFALIGWLNASKVGIAAHTAAASTHVVRSSSVAAHVGKFIHLRFLGKAIVPALKLTQAVLGIGIAISGIGIAFDVVVGGKALIDLVRGKKCSESESLSDAINKAEEHKKVIDSYIQLLEHDAKTLLQKAMDSTKSTKQQITQLQQADDKNREEIERLRNDADQNKLELERLKRADDEKTQKIQYLMEAIEKLNLK